MRVNSSQEPKSTSKVLKSSPISSELSMLGHNRKEGHAKGGIGK